MKRLLLLGMCGGLMLSALAGASAQTEGSIGQITVDGVTGQITASPVDVAGKMVWGITGLAQTASGDTIVLTGTGNPDPILSYSIQATDVGAPSVFSVNFGVPIVPTGPPSSVNGSVSYSVTDSDSDGASLNQAGVDKVAKYFDITNGTLGVDVGNTFGFAPGAEPPFTQSSPAFSANGAPAFQVKSLWADVTFIGSGGGDQYGLTGQVRVNATPEPTALAGLLPAFGLLGLALRRRR